MGLTFHFPCIDLGWILTPKKFILLHPDEALDEALERIILSIGELDESLDEAG